MVSDIYFNFLYRDDTPHVPNEYLGEEAVLRIVGNLTHIIKTLFPSTYSKKNKDSIYFNIKYTDHR